MSARAHHGLLAASGDPFWANVAALLHFDGVNGSTTFTDQTGKAWSAGGSAHIDTSKSKFGVASGAFSANPDRITTPNSAAWDFGTGDFTVETWINFASTAGVQCIVNNYASSSLGWSFQYRDDGVGKRLQFGPRGDINAQYALWIPTAGTWYHVVVCRSGTNLRFFVNGTQIGSTITGFSDSIAGSTSVLAVGSLYYSGLWQQIFNGWIDDFRITNGVARYTANFTAPTASFPNQ